MASGVPGLEFDITIFHLANENVTISPGVGFDTTLNNKSRLPYNKLQISNLFW